MSKAFTKETDDEEELSPPEISSEHVKNYVTETGFAKLQAEYNHLLYTERPKVVEIVRWAAGNGDRSENGDYIYGKKRLREIDRRVRYLAKQLKTAEIVKAELQKGLTKIFFGATVTYKENNTLEKTIKIVGIDEADFSQGKVSWISPIAKALFKSEVGDQIILKTATGEQTLTIIKIKYVP